MKKVLYVSAATVTILVSIMIMTAALGLSEVHALTPDQDLAATPDTVFDASHTFYGEFRTISFGNNNDNIEIVSSNENVCKVYHGRDLATMGEYWNQTSYWYIIPIGPGEATITATNKYNSADKWTGKVKATDDYFQHILDDSVDFGPVEGVVEDDDDPPTFYQTTEIEYGSSYMTVCAPYGAWASLYVDGDLEGMNAAGWFERVDLKQSFLISMKTPVKVKIEWAHATKEYDVKIVSRSTIWTYKIKKNSKKGKAVVNKIHKGDYLKIKVGKKVVKTVKFKSAAKHKTVKWSTKTKMKKGTKVTYTLYNKYKEKLAEETRKVG